jgi:hypothetical protein
MIEKIVAAMVALQPPGQSIYSQTVVEKNSPPGCDNQYSLLCAKPKWSAVRKAWVRPETKAEGLARYRIIAEAVSKQVDPAKILTVMYHESGFREDVHNGFAKGDNGKSWCLGQIQFGRSPEAELPWLPYKAGELVGIDNTTQCIHAIALALELPKCSSVECQFAAYGATSVDSPFVRKRMATYYRANVFLED